MSTPTLDSLFAELEKVLSEPGSTKLIKALVGAFPGPALLAGTDGEVFAASGAWKVLIGFSAEELVGCCWSCRVAPESAASTQNIVSEMSGGRPAFQYRNQWVRRDGSSVSLEWNATAYMDMDGTPVTLAIARAIDGE